MFTRCCKVNLLVFQQCLPPFENVVAGKMVNVTPAEMTCGLRSPIKYCIQTIAIYRECEMCDDGENKHPASYLTDTQEKYDETWWQSVTMLEDVHGQDIHLTVNLGTGNPRYRTPNGRSRKGTVAKSTVARDFRTNF